MNRLFLFLFGTLVATSLFAQKQISEYEQNWPEWRGPYSTGESPLGNPPTSWDETENIKWKVEIKGSGHSTPIVWGDQVFVASSYDTGEKVAEGVVGEDGSGMSPNHAETIYQFILTSYNRDDGTVNWQRVLAEEVPLENTHEDGSWSSNSPVTDGKHVYAYFGSRGIYCLDMEGNQVWSHDFGQMEKRMSFGEGSSPALYGDKVAILWDHEGQSAIYVMNKNTGEIVWQQDRDEPTSWSTPIIFEYNGATQLVTAASNKVKSYNLETGEVIWETSGLTGNVIPHPIYKDGTVWVMSGFRGYAIMAIDMSKASGEITDSDAIMWSYNKYTPYTPSAALYDGLLYYYSANKGSLSCVDALDGTIYYEGAELDDFGNAYPSPVAAAGKIYLVGGSGVSYVIKQGKTFEILSINKLDDKIYASPVIVGSDLYLRGFNYLYCISEE